MTMQEMILLFNFKDKSQIQAVKMVCFQAQVPMRVIPKEKYTLTLRELVKPEVPIPIVEEPIQELDGQMIVFAGLLERKLNKALYLLRENPACGKIPYKAVVTKTNQKWNAYRLLEELKKEHTVMHGGHDEKKRQRN